LDIVDNVDKSEAEILWKMRETRVVTAFSEEKVIHRPEAAELKISTIALGGKDCGYCG
jgi:hypothetical protein